MPWDKITEGRWSGGPWLPSTTEEPETTLYVQRVLAAGGSIINRALIDLAIKTAKYDGYYDSVVAQFLPNAGIKKDSVTTLAAWTGTITLLDESAAVADPSVALTPSKWVTIADGAGGLVRGVVGVDGVSIYDSTELLTRGWETKVGSLNVSGVLYGVRIRLRRDLQQCGPGPL